MRAFRHRHFLPDKELAGFIVANVELRFGQHGGIGGLPEKLHQKSMLTEPDSTPERSSATPVTAPACWRLAGGVLTEVFRAERPVDTSATALAMSGIVIVVGGEDLGADRATSGRPARRENRSRLPPAAPR